MLFCSVLPCILRLVKNVNALRKVEVVVVVVGGYAVTSTTFV